MAERARVEIARIEVNRVLAPVQITHLFRSSNLPQSPKIYVTSDGLPLTLGANLPVQFASEYILVTT